MKVTAFDLLADVEHLRAFTDVLASALGCSELAILRTIVGSIEDVQRRQADDVSDMLRLGRVRQLAARELHRRLGERWALGQALRRWKTRGTRLTSNGPAL